MSELKIKSKLLASASVSHDGAAIALRGEIDLNNSPELRRLLLEIIAAHRPPKLMIDVSGVPYLDSSAVAVLVESLRKMWKSGGRIILTNPQPRVKGLLEIARLDTIFGLAGEPVKAAG